MYKHLRVAVVIPAFCEENRIQSVVTGLPIWVDQIIVVDDKSTDRTYEVACEIKDARLTVIRLDQNQGVGGATLRGFDRALELGADIIVKMDGDGQMDSGGLPALLEMIHRGDADYVKGNRFLHSRQLVKMPLLRRFGNIGLSFMAKLASGYWSIFDPNNGYVAIRSDVLRFLDRARIQPRFFFENSMLLELGLNRAVVRDVYMPARYGDKVSSLSERKTLIEFPPLLLGGFIRRLMIQYFIRDFTPVSLFLIAGIIATSFGTMWGIYHWYSAAHAGVTASTGTVMIAVLPIILGIQLLLQALVMDIQNTPREPLHGRQSRSKDD